MAVLFDTLKFARELRPSFSQEQAEALATAVAGSAQDTIATKADIASIRGEMIEMKAELKGDIASIRGEMIEMKAELKGDIATVKVDLVRWIVGAIAFNFAATAGLIITAMKLFR